jgi:Fic family protein
MDDMRTRFGGLPSRHEAASIWRDIWREEAHHSTAIEGNTLVQREVDQLLEHGLTGARRKELTEYLVVKGYGNAAEWVYATGIDPSGDWSNGDLLSLTEVRHVHRSTMSLAWDVEWPSGASLEEGPGQFRQHEIEPFAGGMQPPSWPLVPSAVSDWLKAVNDLRSDDPCPIEAVADTHAEFERIHPFYDGNGRAGRLLLNLTLVRLGMPPAIIYARDRSRYLNALSRADSGDTGALAELLARAVLNNLHRLMLPKLAGPARYVPLATLADGNVSHAALRSAAARGRLRAVQDKLGQWQSSRENVDEYLRDRNAERGRPRSGS